MKQTIQNIKEIGELLMYATIVYVFVLFLMRLGDILIYYLYEI